MRDKYGYPLEDATAEPFHGPVDLPLEAAMADLVEHATAYAAYQERFRVNHLAKVRRRSQHPPADDERGPVDRP